MSLKFYFALFWEPPLETVAEIGQGRVDPKAGVEATAGLFILCPQYQFSFICILVSLNVWHTLFPFPEVNTGLLENATLTHFWKKNRKTKS